MSLSETSNFFFLSELTGIEFDHLFLMAIPSLSKLLSRHEGVPLSVLYETNVPFFLTNSIGSTAGNHFLWTVFCTYGCGFVVWIVWFGQSRDRLLTTLSFNRRDWTGWPSASFHLSGLWFPIEMGVSGWVDVGAFATALLWVETG